MQTFHFDIVQERTAIRDKMMFLVLQARSSLPAHRWQATFQPRQALDGIEQTAEVFHSPANNQLVVIVPRGNGRLLLRGKDLESFVDVDEAMLELRQNDLEPPDPVPEPADDAGGGGNDNGSGPGRPRSRFVSLERTAAKHVRGEHLWSAIRRSSEGLSFPRFARFVELAFCDDPRNYDSRESVVKENLIKELQDTSKTSFRTDSYDRLQATAEIFVLANAALEPSKEFSLVDPTKQADDVDAYLKGDNVLPYLRIIYDRLGLRPPDRLMGRRVESAVERCRDILDRKRQEPLLIELIWSYWHEEAMQAQAMAAISQRFQNRRAMGERDPLVQLEIDPLRPLNHLLWKHVQGESDRLSVLRRAHEYEHEYGFPLHGKAVAPLRVADRRSKFVEAFHNLLYRCVQFYQEDDDTTHVADGFPVLNALKETHYVLSQAAHNQFGDLPATARQEMLIEQWLLSRPEMREFLGSRPMVAYPEPWMDRVDTVKTLKGWHDVSVVHFHDLAVFSEQLLLSIRWDQWSTLNDPDNGKQWARAFRPQIQGTIHAIRATLGLDLAATTTSARDEADRYLPPSVHLRRRLSAQTAAR